MRQTIMQHLRTHGEQLDSQIALATGFAIDDVRSVLTGLSKSRDVITCHVIRFEGETKIEGTLYRLSAYMPPVKSRMGIFNIVKAPDSNMEARQVAA